MQVVEPVLVLCAWIGPFKSPPSGVAPKQVIRTSSLATKWLSRRIVQNLTFFHSPAQIHDGDCIGPIVPRLACYYPRRLNWHFSINNGTKEGSHIGHLAGQERPQTAKEAPEDFFDQATKQQRVNLTEASSYHNQQGSTDTTASSATGTQ